MRIFPVKIMKCKDEKGQTFVVCFDPRSSWAASETASLSEYLSSGSMAYWEYFIEVKEGLFFRSFENKSRRYLKTKETFLEPPKVERLLGLKRNEAGKWTARFEARGMAYALGMKYNFNTMNWIASTQVYREENPLSCSCCGESCRTQCDFLSQPQIEQAIAEQLLAIPAFLSALKSADNPDRLRMSLAGGMKPKLWK